MGSSFCSLAAGCSGRFCLLCFVSASTDMPHPEDVVLRPVSRMQGQTMKRRMAGGCHLDRLMADYLKAQLQLWPSQ